VVGPYERDNKPLVSIKAEKFLVITEKENLFAL
jgi:hypothetical protein